MSGLVLKLDSPRVSHEAENYLLPSFPPPDDFPIAVAGDGRVLSRYGDPRWNLSFFAGRSLWLDFGIAPKRRDAMRLSPGNSELLKLVMLYYMYGERSMLSPESLRFVITSVRPIFKLCTDNGILVSQLRRFPLVLSQIPAVLAQSKVPAVMTILYELYNARELLGFEMADVGEIQKLLKSATSVEKKQNPYIPARLWLYQIRRCREMLQDFISHRLEFEALFKHCVGVYEREYGSITAFFRGDGVVAGVSAFSSTSKIGAGSFADAARKHGVAEIIDRWVIDSDRTIDESGIRALGKYFSAVQFVGALYLATVSGMRRAEVGRLRSDCLVLDRDDRLGEIFMLRGDTSKTVDDDSALWITSPTAKIAVDAMAAISTMRMSMAVLDPRLEIADDVVDNPYLITRSYEPWGVVKESEYELGEDARVEISYGHWKTRCPGLFEANELRITAEDFRAAVLVTPSLDNEKYAVGKPWNFTMHQLRRTLNVNATYSGVVSLPSLQYEMKHQTPAMSLYYGQGHSQIKLNKAMTKEFIATMFQALAVKAATLLGDDFVSPLGEEHKARMLEFVSQRTASQLLAMARSGQISIRETALGVCMSREYCPYGGIDHIAECTKCDKALLDRRRRAKIEEIGHRIVEVMASSNADGPLRECLEAQQVAVKEALDVVLTH